MGEFMPGTSIIAHEFGHLLGLGHDTAGYSLMESTGGDGKLQPDQLEKVLQNAGISGKCGCGEIGSKWAGRP
jgi:hypothetical protein